MRRGNLIYFKSENGKKQNERRLEDSRILNKPKLTHSQGSRSKSRFPPRAQRRRGRETGSPGPRAGSPGGSAHTPGPGPPHRAGPRENPDGAAGHSPGKALTTPGTERSGCSYPTTRTAPRPGCTASAPRPVPSGCRAPRPDSRARI